jgi:hypothetical protein
VAAAITCLALVPVVVPPPAPAAAAVATPSTCGTSAELVPSCGTWWGAHLAVGLSTFEASIGRRIAILHDYLGWTNPFPSASEKSAAEGGRILYVDWSAVNHATGGPAATWAQIASGAQDKVINAEAADLKAFGRRIMLTFNGEPDSSGFASYGTPADYVAAWRHIHARFKADGVRNVVWVWDVTGDVADHGREYPALYPGDSDVDWIMWDPYNWYGCKGGTLTWRSFSAMVATMYSWLTTNSGTKGNGDYLSKPWGLAEYGTVEGPSPTSKEDWFESAIGQAETQYPKLKALVYFDSDNVAPGRSCLWKVTTSVDSLVGFAEAGSQLYVSQLP